jgi:tetratricopeptide (TPR) repeat protein
MPHSVEAVINLGAAYNQAGDYPKAIEVLEQAVGLRPKDAAARNNLGAALFNAGKRKEGAREVELAIQLDPEYVEALNNLGYFCMVMKRHADAVGVLERAVRLDPSFAAARYNLGAAYYAGGKKGRALEEYQKLRGMDEELATRLYYFIFDRQVISVPRTRQ